MLEQVLAALIPFRFIDSSARAQLAEGAVQVDVPAGEFIIHQGDAEDRRVFVLLTGRVEIVDERADKVLGLIDEGRYFGERAALFDTPRVLGIRAARPSRVAIFTQGAFLEALRTSPAMAHALGNILRERQGLFRAFDAFWAELMLGVTDDVVNFTELRRRYRALEPALHPDANQPDVLDFEALAYAMPRLPEGIASAYMLYLTDNFQDHLVEPSRYFREVATAARRRTIYEMAPGKYMVLLRDGVSDLVDLVTCLCAFATEARKIRRRVQRSDRLMRLARFVHADCEGSEDELLAEVGFDAHEREHMRALWPDGAARAVYQLAMHHEDYNVQITKQLQGYNSQHAERWTGQIAAAVEELLGCTPDQIDDALDVHIISSNTHSVQNCLSPYLRERADEIEAWGREHHPELFEHGWHDTSDRLYALTRYWLAAHPGQPEERSLREREQGMLRLDSTALTGIGVDIIDTSKIDLAKIDPAILPQGCARRDGLLINIDYAFGQQAEEILSILLKLFGDNVRSVNILGKAGALQGRRGDVLVATAFIEQTSELLEPLPNPNACELESLRARLPDRSVHVGPVLTVAGTLLQNRVLLNFYRRIWQCTGLEMEGTYYLRELLKAMDLGFIPSDVEMRFVYYVSDLPLASGETLAGSLRAGEGIPPLYAITREILAGVLAG